MRFPSKCSNKNSLSISERYGFSSSVLSPGSPNFGDVRLLCRFSCVTGPFVDNKRSGSNSSQVPGTPAYCASTYYLYFLLEDSLVKC